MRFIQRLTLASLFLFTAVGATGCASYFTRKDCEKRNWFLHGQEVALRGERLSADSYYLECQRVEATIDHSAASQGFKRGMATYCLPETAYQTGRAGKFFSADMCDGENLKLLRQKHAEGVAAYCQKSNGYTAGATGTPYNNICPRELEEAFMPEFNRGRKTYLSSLISQKEAQVSDVERDISRLERQRSELTLQLNQIGDVKTVQTQRRMNAQTGQYEEITTTVDDPKRVNERDRVTSSIRSTNGDIESKQRQRDQLRQEIRQLTAEALRL